MIRLAMNQQIFVRNIIAGGWYFQSLISEKDRFLRADEEESHREMFAQSKVL